MHDQTNERVRSIYPDGLHSTIAAALAEHPDISAGSVTLQQPEHGLSKTRLAATDVLLWWGHIAHDKVDDHIVDRVQARVWEGMGLIVLHSAHFSKIFRRLMGTPCSLTWREAGERERLWVANPSHPIAAGLDACFELAQSEMYGEPFAIPEPDDTLFISWYRGGEVFRSGCTWRRGAGRVFFFAPGHETYPIYHDRVVRQILQNAVVWACNTSQAWRALHTARNRPAKDAFEPLD